MHNNFISKRLFCILSGLSGIVGVVLLIISFSIAVGPPAGATRVELVQFGQQHSIFMAVNCRLLSNRILMLWRT